MATTCEVCGHRTNEVKSGSGIEQKGLRIEVDVNSKDDFSRDILKVLFDANLSKYLFKQILF